MKKTVVAYVLLLIICLCSCGESDYQYVRVSVDYPMYSTAEELVEVAQNVYIGSVTDISFEIFDMKTGKVDSSSKSESTSRMLYTIYTISVKESLKGDVSETVKIRRVGGITGYNEEGQYKKMKDANLIGEYKGIPRVVEEGVSLEIDGKYLFCTNSSVEGYDIVVNVIQFAHQVNSEIATQIMNECKK